MGFSKQESVPVHSLLKRMTQWLLALPRVPTCLPAPEQWRGSRLEIAWYSGWLASTLSGLHWGPAPALLALALPSTIVKAATANESVHT